MCLTLQGFMSLKTKQGIYLWLCVSGHIYPPQEKCNHAHIQALVQKKH